MARIKNDHPPIGVLPDLVIPLAAPGLQNEAPLPEQPLKLPVIGNPQLPYGLLLLGRSRNGTRASQGAMLAKIRTNVQAGPVDDILFDRASLGFDKSAGQHRLCSSKIGCTSRNTSPCAF